MVSTPDLDQEVSDSNPAEPASVAQSNARTTCDQELTNSIPVGYGNILSCSRKLFYSHSLPSADSRRAVVSLRQKNVHKVNRLVKTYIWLYYAQNENELFPIFPA